MSYGESRGAKPIERLFSQTPIAFNKYTVSASFTANTIEIKMYSAFSGKFKAAIYCDNGGTPVIYIYTPKARKEI